MVELVAENWDIVPRKDTGDIACSASHDEIRRKTRDPGPIIGDIIRKVVQGDEVRRLSLVPEDCVNEGDGLISVECWERLVHKQPRLLSYISNNHWDLGVFPSLYERERVVRELHTVHNRCPGEKHDKGAVQIELLLRCNLRVYDLVCSQIEQTFSRSKVAACFLGKVVVVLVSILCCEQRKRKGRALHNDLLEEPKRWLAREVEGHALEMGHVRLVVHGRETANNRHTVPPADCPKMVTLFGSPPNCAMLLRTHSRERRWSRMP